MRLLLVSGDRRVATGAGGPFAELLEALAPYWDRIDVLCPWSTGAEPHVLFDRVHLRPVRLGRLTAPFDYVRAASRLDRPDLVASHDYGLCAGGIAAWRLAARWGVPHASEVHGVPGLPRPRSVRQAVEKAILTVYLRTIGRRAAGVRAVNPAELAHFLRRTGVSPARILDLPAIYLDHAVYSPGDGPAEFDVAWAARFVPGKGLETFLEAIALLATERPDVKVALVGDGPLAPLARCRVESLGLTDRVRFLGWLATPRELAEVYRRSRLFVLASDFEGGPRAPVEAMACGVPALVTPVGILPAVVRPGENGDFTDGRPAALARRMADLLADEPRRRRMGRAAAEAARGFERGALVRRYAEVYLAIARGERPPIAPPARAARERPLRVLLLTQVVDEDDPVLGVVPHWIRALARRVDQLVVVALSAGRFEAPANVRVVSLGKPLGDAPVRGGARLALFARWLRTSLPLVARREVDVVFAHMVPLYAILGAILGRPFGRRAVLWYAHRSLDGRVRAAHGLVAAVATAGESSFRLASRKRRVLGHGIPLANFARPVDPGRLAEVRRRLGPGRILLSVGRMSPVKDLETLVDAARIARAALPDLALALIGAPPLPGDEGYLERLRARARPLGDAVRFLDPVPYDDLPAWYQTADWVASASRTGSLDKNGLEAIASERSFFASNEAFLPVWGEAARDFVFPAGDGAALAARLVAFESLDADERAATLARLRRRVEADHDLEQLAGRLADLFRSVRP